VIKGTPVQFDCRHCGKAVEYTYGGGKVREYCSRTCYVHVHYLENEELYKARAAASKDRLRPDRPRRVPRLETDATWRCNSCARDLPPSDFSKGQWKCKTCYRAYYKANRATILANVKRWEAANPERTRAARVEVSARRRARKHGTVVVPYSRADVLKRDVGKPCYLCGAPLRKADKVHIDHITPLARGGHDRIENVAAVHATCNYEKHAHEVTLPLWAS
jgi:5-methylcytosine-specific restriction endonuclease McrA